MWSVEENTDHGVLLSANICKGGKNRNIYRKNILGQPLVTHHFGCLVTRNRATSFITDTSLGEANTCMGKNKTPGKEESTSPEWRVNMNRNGGSTCSGIYNDEWNFAFLVRTYDDPIAIGSGR
jgi:hypothetical protein